MDNEVLDMNGRRLNVGDIVVFATADRYAHGAGVLRTGQVTAFHKNCRISIRVHESTDLEVAYCAGDKGKTVYASPRTIATGRVVVLQSTSNVMKW